jgi:hypothetical protein
MRYAALRERLAHLRATTAPGLPPKAPHGLDDGLRISLKRDHY